MYCDLRLWYCIYMQLVLEIRVRTTLYGVPTTCTRTVLSAGHGGAAVASAKAQPSARSQPRHQLHSPFAELSSSRNTPCAPAYASCEPRGVPSVPPYRLGLRKGRRRINQYGSGRKLTK